MKNNPRLDRVVALIDEAGFLTVADISRLCEVSEMTIRRYLDLLDEQKRIKRIYGGAVSLNKVIEDNVENAPPLDKRDEVLLVDQVDVLIGTSVNPYYDSLLIERSKRRTSRSLPNRSKCRIKGRLWRWIIIKQGMILGAGQEITCVKKVLRRLIFLT